MRNLPRFQTEYKYFRWLCGKVVSPGQATAEANSRSRRSTATVYPKPVGQLAIVPGVEDRDVGVLSWLETSLLVLQAKAQAPL